MSCRTFGVGSERWCQDSWSLDDEIRHRNAECDHCGADERGHRTPHREQRDDDHDQYEKENDGQRMPRCSEHGWICRRSWQDEKSCRGQSEEKYCSRHEVTEDLVEAAEQNEYARERDLNDRS